MRRWLRSLFAGGKRSAAPVRTHRPVIELLEDRTVPTVTYQGGALLTHVEAQAVYLGADWTRSANLPQTRTLDNFLQSLVGGAYMDTLSAAGYGVGRGTASAGRIDPIPLDRSFLLTDGAIQADLQAAISHRLVDPPDANRLYVIFVQPEVAVRANDGSISRTDFLGYHSAMIGHDASGQIADVRYAVVSYPGGAIGNAEITGLAPVQDLTEVASHEIAEAVTDPDVDYSVVGWYDDSFNGEVGDITNQQFVTLNGYVVQRIADRNDQAMTPAGAAPLQPATFVLLANGQLFERNARGLTFLSGGVATVSNQGIDNSGHAMVDVVLATGQAYEYHDGIGWLFLSSGAKDARAGQGVSYVLFQNGQLREYRDANAAWDRTLAQNVVTMDAGTDRYGVNMVDAVFSNGGFSTYSDSTGWDALCGEAQTVSAGELGVSVVLLRDSRAFEYQGAKGIWHYLGANVAHVVAGFDSRGAVIELISRTGVVTEYRAGMAPHILTTGVRSISEPDNGVVDIVYINGQAFQRTASGALLLGSKAQSAV